MPEQVLEFTTVDGSSLSATWTQPPGEGPFAAMLCVHGLTLTQEIFAEAAQDLARAGLASLRVDLRGHGASGGRLQDQGFKDQWADVAAAFQVLARHPWADPQRLGLLGFSMGASLCALLASQQPQVKALALWSPLLKTEPWNLERRGQYGLPKDGLQEIWDGIIVSERLFTEALQTDPYEAALKFGGPLLVCHGGKDRNHPQARSLELAAARPAKGLAIASYFAPASGHRWLHPSERAQRTALTAAFFSEAL